MNTQRYVIKSTGDEEVFDPGKLDNSLRRAGASAPAREHIVAYISTLLSERTLTTSEIYRRAFELLKSRDATPIAARYSVKKAIFDLGPSGYPFESFLTEILRSHGWRAQQSVVVQGHCVSHEIDVLATKGGKRIGIEAKFHNTSGIKTDVRDALYVHARYQDLATARDADDHVDEGWLVTNTRFTDQAVQYGECVGLPMISWDYPAHGNLLDLIEEGKVHPLTCMTTLSSAEKQVFLDNRIVLCRTLATNAQVLRQYGIRPEKIDDVQQEARQLCLDS